ncbi:MAG: DUF3179 domain-containing protein, partial [Gemmatimonadetes bacterium]|nr:DUF3179 domain-containing protein [Gemmatimonadota bacterium]NIT66267.1 DUF3179 domain-containing protein [Gemmatimonadota bacterium]NIV22826.1 DUF3179 domain-containing protein [Gemmatimonadota bacterium]NIW74691.1 DUF3179 domain-containing protein [Gemmatimonadota bacterium]NIY34844.1 DUF3179 domain-containing protein [Gemmatimonadota bacterium]
GYDRRYGRNPYVRYDRGKPNPMFFRRDTDGRLPAMERVVALTPEQEPPRAYPFSSLREARVVNDELDGAPIVVFWAPGTASALDAARIARGRDVGS